MVHRYGGTGQPANEASTTEPPVVELAGKVYPVERWDQLVSCGERVDVKLTKRAILIGKRVDCESFLAGIRSARAILAQGGE